MKRFILTFVLFFSAFSLFAAGKLLSSSEYRKILMQSGSDYFPSKIDGVEFHSFDIKVLGEVNSSAGHIAVLRSDVVWGSSERCTSRIVFFLNGKPYGHFYELQPHETLEPTILTGLPLSTEKTEDDVYFSLNLKDQNEIKKLSISQIMKVRRVYQLGIRD